MITSIGWVPSLGHVQTNKKRLIHSVYRTLETSLKITAQTLLEPTGVWGPTQQKCEHREVSGKGGGILHKPTNPHSTASQIWHFNGKK